MDNLFLAINIVKAQGTYLPTEELKEKFYIRLRDLQGALIAET